MEKRDSQSAFKARLKGWLKGQHLGYKWMADQCGVSEVTVRGWMARKPIPFLKQQLLERLIVQFPNQSAEGLRFADGVEVSSETVLSIKVSQEVYQKLLLKAHEAGLDVHVLVARTIADLVKASFQMPPISSVKVVLPSESEPENLE